MYKLAVLAVVKNNASILKEWVEHYLAEGVEHIYLVDNRSTDDTFEVMGVYKDYVTIIKSGLSKLPNVPGSLLNNIYINRVKCECEWVMFANPDEYFYSRNSRFWQLPQVLQKLDDSVEKVWVPRVYFGPNGYIEQPTEVVKSFIKRQELTDIVIGKNGRVICRTEHLVKIENEGENVELSQNNLYYLCNGQRADKFKFTEKAFSRLDIHMNAYMPMSKEYYESRAQMKFGKDTPDYIKAMEMFDVYSLEFDKVEDVELAFKLYTYNPEVYNT
mgnify:CR=1 FL=1